MQNGYHPNPQPHPAMHQGNHSTILVLMRVALLLAIPLGILMLASPHQPSFYTKPSAEDYLQVETKTLEEALAEVAIDNKTIIITFMSKYELEFEGNDRPIFDLFLDGYSQGEDTHNLMNHLLIVTLDQKAYLRCTVLRLHCHMLEYREFAYGEPQDLSNTMGETISYLGDVLRFGYNIIFTETDVLWLRNPIPILLQSQSQNETMDLQISVKKFNGNKYSDSNLVSTGVYMVRSNNRTIKLFEEWEYKIRLFTEMKEQDVLQIMIREGVHEKLGLKVRFLDTLYFSGFCEDSIDIRAVATVHANCCRTVKAKVKDMTTAINCWNKFRSSPDAPFKWSKHKYCKASSKELL